MKLNQLTITQALAGLKSKKFTSVELTKACLDQIERTDSKINAFIAINPEAFKEAKQADAKIAADPKAFESEPLLGIPYALKDNFCSANLRTSASSKVLDKFVPSYDSTVVAKLRSAGAIILGKTNMDAWAHGSSTETSDYGPTKNPWNIEHLPGGSSGGSAAAVASDECIFAIGSETAGSIRQPAAWCGVSGFKPTYGRVSRYGVVAMASSTDSPGPLTKTIEDALIVTQVIAGHDSFDGTSSPKAVDLSLSRLSKASVKGMKIGVPREYLLDGMNPDALKLVRQAIDKFKQLGAEIIDLSLIDPKYAIGVYTIVQRSEVSSNLARYQQVRYGSSRDDLGMEAKRRIMLGTFALSSGYYDQYYNKAQKVRSLIINDFAKAFEQVDLIVGPVSPTPALKLGASDGQAMFGEMEDILVEASSVAGLCSASVNCGFVDGLPIGLQITGAQFAEQKVLEAAHVYQVNTDFHTKKPTI